MRNSDASPDHPVDTVAGFARRSTLELLRIAYLLTGDRYRAEDLVQEVLLAMHRRFGDVLTLDNPVAYAHRALVNANTSWRRRGASSEVVTELFADTATVSDDDPAERDAMWTALRRVPTRPRTVLVARYYLDMSDADIAALLDCRLGTVRSLASRGIAVLRADPSLDHTKGGTR